MLLSRCPLRDRLMPAEWALWLQDEQEADLAVLRRQTHTGRPCGSEAFVLALASQLGRTLRPAKRGRKPKPQHKEQTDEPSLLASNSAAICYPAKAADQGKTMKTSMVSPDYIPVITALCWQNAGKKTFIVDDVTPSNPIAGLTVQARTQWPADGAKDGVYTLKYTYTVTQKTLQLEDGAIVTLNSGNQNNVILQCKVGNTVIGTIKVDVDPGKMPHLSANVPLSIVPPRTLATVP